MWIAVLCELCSHCSIAVWLIEMKLFTICQSLAVQGCSIWDSSFITRAFRKGCWCFEQSLALQAGVCAGVQHWNVPWGSLLATHPLMWSEAKQSWSVVSSCQTQELCPLLSWLGPTNTGMGLVGLCLMLVGTQLLSLERSCIQLGFCRKAQAVWKWDLHPMSEFCLFFPAFVTTSEISCCFSGVRRGTTSSASTLWSF